MEADRTATVEVLDTPIRIKPTFWAVVLAGWAFMAWVAGRGRPQRSLATRVSVGFLSMLALVSADVSHAFAHIVSARLAEAPMDEIVLSHGMPRTIYHDQSVTAQQHRLRAVGGPVYSGLSLLTALLFRRLAPEDSIWHELLTWSSVGHGFIFLGGLAPLPFVDGGSMIKWTLVEQGKSEGEAEAIVQQVDLALGGALAVTGGAVALTGRRGLGLALLAAGAVSVGAGLDLIS